MGNFLELATEVICEAKRNKPMATKFLGETAMVCRALCKLGAIDKQKMSHLISQIYEMLHCDFHLELSDSSFDTPQFLMPYAAIRDYSEKSYLFESALKIMAEHNNRRSERLPYTKCEDQYILYMAGCKTHPEFGSPDWDKDCLQVFNFNVQDAYVFTHRYIYSRDFGLMGSPKNHIKAGLFLLLTKATIWENTDLVFEVAFCLLAEKLTSDELGLLDAFVKRQNAAISAIKEKVEVSEKYHEIYVEMLFKAARLHHPKICEEPHPHDAQKIIDLMSSLTAKDPAKIVKRYIWLHKTFPMAAHFQIFVATKLSELRRMAENKILFERECRLTQTDPNTVNYKDVLERVDGAVKELNEFLITYNVQPIPGNKNAQSI